MIVLNTNASQTLKVIPREYLGAFTIDVRDTSLNKNFTYKMQHSYLLNNNFAISSNYRNAKNIMSLMDKIRSISK